MAKALIVVSRSTASIRSARQPSTPIRVRICLNASWITPGGWPGCLWLASAQNLPAALGPDLTAAVDLAKAEKALSTRKAYGTDFRLFKAWCEAKGVSPLPAGPETVAAFLAAETGNGTKPSTLGRRVAAIRYAHKLGHLDTPTDSEAVKATLRGYQAHRGHRQGAKGSCGSRQGTGDGCACP